MDLKRSLEPLGRLYPILWILGFEDQIKEIIHKSEYILSIFYVLSNLFWYILVNKTSFNWADKSRLYNILE